MVPTLKVLKAIPAKSKIPPIRKNSNSSQELNATSSINGGFDIDTDEPSPHLKTIYNVDYKDRGFDVCMAKAYGILAKEKNQDDSQSIDLSTQGSKSALVK